MQLLHGFLVLISLLLFGDLLSESLNLPVPGSVIGMLSLLIVLCVRKGVPDSVGAAADGLIRYIGLLFVPAGAGASLYLGLIAEEWKMILVASFTSTFLTLIACAWLFKALSKNGDA